MCQRPAPLCWMAAEKTGRNGKPWLSSKRTWSMEKATKANGIEMLVPPPQAQVHIGDTVIVEYCDLLNTVWIGLMFCHCCIIVSTFQDRAWLCRSQDYLKTVCFFYYTWLRWKKTCRGGFCYPTQPTRRYWCRHLTVLRACCFTDVHSCLVIVLWPVSERLLHFAPFLSLFPFRCVML